MVVTSFMVSADHGDTGKFPLRTSHGCQRNTFHAGDVFEDFLQLVHAAQIALTDGFRRQWMAVQKSRQTGCLMSAAGIVFHRAGAERIELSVYREILARKVRVVPHDLQLGHFRKGGWLGAQQRPGNTRWRAHIRRSIQYLGTR